MSTNSPEDPPVRRIDRILAFMALGITVLSVVCLFAVVISTAAGMTHADYAEGIWPIVGILPMIGLPIAFLLILALLITSIVRRGRARRS